MMQNREYQRSAVEKLPLLFSNDPSVVLVSPTGSGKSVMGAHFVQGSTRYRRIVWAAHRIELLRQARAELIEAGVPESEVGLVSGAEKINPGARVLVGSIALMARREEQDVDLVVVDEAHRVESASYQQVVAMHPQANILGLTATPKRLDEKPLGRTFSQMLIAATPTELEASGYISKPITYGIPEATARSIVRGVKDSGGDYAAGELGRRMMRGLGLAEALKGASLETEKPR